MRVWLKDMCIARHGCVSCFGCVSMFDCGFVLSSCLCGRQCFDLSVPLIVRVDLSSKFEGSGLSIYLERLRRLELWLVSCWCGCSLIRFCFRILMVHDLRRVCPQSQGVSNWNV